MSLCVTLTLFFYYHAKSHFRETFLNDHTLLKQSVQLSLRHTAVKLDVKTDCNGRNECDCSRGGFSWPNLVAGGLDSQEKGPNGRLQEIDCSTCIS